MLHIVELISVSSLQTLEHPASILRSGANVKFVQREVELVESSLWNQGECRPLHSTHIKFIQHIVMHYLKDLINLNIFER